MTVIRVHQLAKELDVESRTILDTAADLGIDVTTALSGLDDTSANHIRTELITQRPSAIRVHQLAKELDVESRTILDTAADLCIDVTTALSGLDDTSANHIRTAISDHRSQAAEPSVEVVTGSTADLPPQPQTDEPFPVRPLPERRFRERSGPAPRIAPLPYHSTTKPRVAFYLLAATVFAIQLEAVLLIPGLGTLSRILGLGVFAAWLLGVAITRQVRKPESFHYLAYALVVWVAASLYWSLDTGSTAGRAFTFVQLLMLMIIIWDLCDTPESIRTLLQVYVLSSWATVLSVFFNFSRNTESSYGRFASEGVADPNVMAVILAIGIPIAWYLALEAKSGMLRLVNLLYVPAAVLAITLSGSRGGFVATAVALTFVASVMPRKKPMLRVIAFLVLAVGAVAVATIVPSETFERVGGTAVEITAGDLSGRTQIWGFARDVFLEHPLVGTGAGSTRQVLPVAKVGHNVAVSVGLELGIVGLFLFGSLLVVVFQRALSLVGRPRHMWLTILVIWSVGALTLDLEAKKVTWVLFSLVVAAAAVARERYAEGTRIRDVWVQPPESRAANPIPR